MIRLTAEMVRAALRTIDVPGITDTGDIAFRAPITRDGRGWLARVALPAGAPADAVVARYRDLAVAFQPPVDQLRLAVSAQDGRHLDLWIALDPA